jgi:hypothetical protein
MTNKYVVAQIMAQLLLLGARATLKVLLNIVDDVYQNFISEYGDKISFKNHIEEQQFKAYFEQTWANKCRELNRKNIV